MCHVGWDSEEGSGEGTGRNGSRRGGLLRNEAASK